MDSNSWSSFNIEISQLEKSQIIGVIYFDPGFFDKDTDIFHENISKHHKGPAMIKPLWEKTVKIGKKMICLYFKRQCCWRFIKRPPKKGTMAMYQSKRKWRYIKNRGEDTLYLSELWVWYISLMYLSNSKYVYSNVKIG